MELFSFRLLVSDFAAAVHFWRDLMHVSLQFQDEALGYAYFDTGKVGLELMRRDDCERSGVVRRDDDVVQHAHFLAVVVVDALAQQTTTR